MTHPIADPDLGLSALTAAELVAGYRSGAFTPLDATRSVLETIEERDPAVNAFVRVDPDGALSQAAESTQRWQAGQPLGSADGVPTSVKDILWTAGMPTLRATWLIDEAGPWPEDAPAVARLREAAAVITGKTTTPEFAWKGVTDSLRHGSTGNPWDPSLTSGGSSGGAAAAVGLGMGPWALGTDGGGSVRIPASFTGTVTIKPTYGLIPLFPASPFGTLSHAGPMTRTVTDAAALLDVVAGFDSRDWSAMPTPATSFLTGLDDGVEGLRIAFSPTLGYVQNDPEVERLVRAAVAVLEDAGAEVEEVDPGFTDPVEAFDVLWFCGAAKVLDAYPAGSLDRIEPLLREGIETKGRGSAADYLDATAVRMDLGRRMGRFHETYDLLVTPTMPITAFERGLQAPQGWPSQWWPSWTPYTYPFNMTQQPAASVPCGTTAAGLPVGLQVVGARHDDARVLRAARAYERASGELFVRPVDNPRGAR
ncbi:aspartyl-tRNA(Asn)/glutamyl-tRNA(Gln) amidotransferase subunit A [Nocardioides luteus]|uniref:Amidase n=1 Tax=Nocardioides luteus TaxID=1844 RepID=A0ABQ5T4B9_9ACTN|nr:amidase [Nocardioides luteus]MDR7310213.1 aspartyl-tRNA(Asn)/glutamyl-tRNA(Gln) amidotransferase subunit A [Nocardioides luteus]GGR69600.1 amidase [Nocardioides luteus]GLJ70319.1 amidase [Nocardioides luteus]